MCSQDRVNVLADVFDFKFPTYDVAYVGNRILRKLAPPRRISNMELGVEDNETDPTLVRNKLM